MSALLIANPIFFPLLTVHLQASQPSMQDGPGPEVQTGPRALGPVHAGAGVTLGKVGPHCGVHQSPGKEHNTGTSDAVGREVGSGSRWGGPGRGRLVKNRTQNQAVVTRCSLGVD